MRPPRPARRSPQSRCRWPRGQPRGLGLLGARAAEACFYSLPPAVAFQRRPLTREERATERRDLGRLHWLAGAAAIVSPLTISVKAGRPAGAGPDHGPTRGAHGRRGAW